MARNSEKSQPTPHSADMSTEKKDQALVDALADIEKRYGRGAIMKLGDAKNFEVEVISTGSLAIDLAPKGVRVNMVSPGTIIEDGNTWGRQRDAGAERYKRMLARNPTGRMGTPQEVAAAVVFLAGTPASFVTGINFIVDGAITARVQY